MWLSPHLGDEHVRDLRYAIRVATAAVLAYAVSTGLGLPQGFWSVISAVIVVQASIGGTLVAAQERAIGTIVGAAVGGVASSLHPANAVATALTLGGCVGVLAFAAAHRPSLRMAPITASILIAATASRDGSFSLAIDRVLEILLGCGVGVATTALLFPATQRLEPIRDAIALAHEFAILIRARADELVSGEMDPLQAQHDAIRLHIAKIEKDTGEARRTPGGRARTEKRSALVRTIWRVRNDTVAVKRAMEATTSVQPGPTLDAARAMMMEQARFLEALGTEQDATILRRALDDRMAGLNAAVEETRFLNRTERLALPRLGLVFALQSLTDNVTDLADRLAELQADVRRERLFLRLRRRRST